MDYPIRINKYLSERHICSRKEADELIAEGRIRINKRVAVLGDKVDKGDDVRVAKEYRKELIYLAFNKPKGIITHSAQRGEREIKDILAFSKRVYPVGRLDKDSRGLIILTNDGRITDKLLNPDRDHEKEYTVKVNQPFKDDFVVKMAGGVVLDDGYKTKRCKVKRMSADLFSIVLTEGKKHQIRRMCEALGFVVTDLRRTRIMNIKIEKLRPGEFKRIEGKELKQFLSLLGMRN